jgi:CRISPR-associated protein Cas2
MINALTHATPPAGVTYADEDQGAGTPGMPPISATAVPDHVRGALTCWLTKPALGLYVGTVSARVREGLWSAISTSVDDGAVICIHPAENEQRYQIRTAGQRRRVVFDSDGLQLVRFSALERDLSS